MRISAFVALMVVIVAAFAPQPAAAAYNLPWCAFLSDSEAYSCAFRSLEQCWATVLGVGGFCRPNYRYAVEPPPALDRELRRTKRRNPDHHH